MKLASQKQGRDGSLIVVSRDTLTACDASHIAATLQLALDNWESVEGKLQELYDTLNSGNLAASFDLDFNTLAAPLPRSYQYLDGACYASHIKRNRAARGESVPDDFYQQPLMYQGISHGFMAWNDPIKLPNDEMGIDFEAEIAAITGDVPIGVKADEAHNYIRFFVLLNDISLRALIPAELKRTFGFLVAKPASSLGPIVVTPDELGDLWSDGLVSGTMKCWVRGEKVGEINSGIDTPYHYGHLIAHVAQTRPFEPGSIVGLGTISNEDESAGCGCLGEIRALEVINKGEASTSFLKFGDSVKIEHYDHAGNSVFGCIEQKVVALD